MRLLNPTKRREYILEADRGSDNPTVFVLRRLTREEFFEFAALAPFSAQQAEAIERIVRAARRERRALNADEQAALAQIMPDTRAALRALTRANEFAARCGLVEIRNLLDEEMRPLEMSVADFARFAPADVIQELGAAVIDWSVLAEAERKNSGAQSAPGSPAQTAQSAPESTTSRPAA